MHVARAPLYRRPCGALEQQPLVALCSDHVVSGDAAARLCNTGYRIAKRASWLAARVENAQQPRNVHGHWPGPGAAWQYPAVCDSAGEKPTVAGRMPVANSASTTAPAPPALRGPAAPRRTSAAFLGPQSFPAAGAPPAPRRASAGGTLPHPGPESTVMSAGSLSIPASSPHCARCALMLFKLHAWKILAPRRLRKSSWVWIHAGIRYETVLYYHFHHICSQKCIKSPSVRLWHAKSLQFRTSCSKEKDFASSFPIVD